MKTPMEQKTGVKSVSFLWKLAIFLPIAAALALQVLSPVRTHTHVNITLSVLGTLFFDDFLGRTIASYDKKANKLGNTAAHRLDLSIWLRPIRIAAFVLRDSHLALLLFFLLCTIPLSAQAGRNDAVLC